MEWNEFGVRIDRNYDGWNEFLEWMTAKQCDTSRIY